MAVDYGSDISCFVGTGGLDPDFRVISGPLVIAESVARLWLTPPGSLITDENEGFDLRTLLGAETSVAYLASVKATLVTVALRGERRVKRISVDLTYDPQLQKVTVRATIKPRGEDEEDESEVPFDFVLTVDKLTPKLVLAEAAS